MNQGEMEERIIDFAFPDKEDRDRRWELRSRIAALLAEARRSWVGSVKGEVLALERRTYTIHDHTKRTGYERREENWIKEESVLSLPSLSSEI